MQARPKNTMEQLLPLLMQTGVGIVILLIIWLVIANLPMLERISFPLKFSLTELLVAVILTVIMGMLLSFASRIELRLGYLVTSFPQCGTMVKQFVYLIVILIAYFAFNPLAVPYLADTDWVYHLLFLIAFLAILATLAHTIYSNMERLSQLFTASKGRAVSGPAALLCSKCGEKNAGGTRFCAYCGEELPQPLKCSGCGNIIRAGAKFCSVCGADIGEAAAVGKTDPGVLSCRACGYVLKPGAKFCPKCGARVEERALEKQAEVGAVEEEAEPPVPVCPGCGAELKPGARFCPRCGTAQ